jgi:hypothetical protein
VLRKVEGEALELDGLDGKKIGESLARSLAVNTQATAAVDAWIGNFPALKELDEEYEWFRPMIETISYRLLEEVPWGLKARVTVGAITSMADLLTDVYVTYMFWSDGKEVYFKASLASLAVSIGIQMLLVWGQNKQLGVKRVLREWFPILIGFKPAVDAYRVAKGGKQEAGQAVDALTELTFMKVIEMFAEAIPGVIIQLMAIATNKGAISRSAWISLTVSALTTGFASASISYDWDTDPAKREWVPHFYGYIPSNSTNRSIIFASITFFSAGMLLIRCMTIVVLGLIGGKWVALYIGGDLVLYLTLKLVRGDFWYWAHVGGQVEILSSIIIRVMVKVITDFTSIPQFRHPYEVGGFYWAFGFVLTLGSLPLTLNIANSEKLAERATSLGEEALIYLIPFTLLSFAVFFCNIERSHLHTFFSSQRGIDLTKNQFLNSKTDFAKGDAAFNASVHHTYLFQKEIKLWVEANWERWEEEKPKWLDEAMRARVPVDYIPTAAGRNRESVRRASVYTEGGLGGAFRASIRRASVGLTIEGHVKVVPIERDN